jgi:cytochrome c biogenesis protein CcmG/thiol:disulfide interchange protein DsbE
MQKNQRIIFYILLLIAGAAWIILSAEITNVGSESSSAPQAGFVAPDFTLNTPAGNTFTLSELRGQAVLLNLWASWCPPCRAEMPTIEKIYNEYKNRGFIVLAVDMTYQDNTANIAPFVQKYSLTYPILLEETGNVASLYQLRSLPSSYFIDRTGIIQKVIIGGPMSEALLRTRVEQILQ